MAAYCVYKHTFPNNKVYIGITCQDPIRRWGRHGSGYQKQPIVFAAIIKYGWDNIKHEVIFTDLSESEAKLAEQTLIKAHNSMVHNNGYNSTPGGDYRGVVSTVTRQRMSNAQKGRTFSEDTRAKMSAAKRGRAQPKELVQKRIHHTPRSPEARLQCAKAQGKPVAQYMGATLIATYISANEATRQTGVNHIAEKCDGKRTGRDGYEWRWC